jgi:hypothetical protein
MQLSDRPHHLNKAFNVAIKFENRATNKGLCITARKEQKCKKSAFHTAQL